MSNENLNNMPQDKDSNNYTGILLEDINDKMSGVLEAVSAITGSVNEIKSRVEKIEENTNLIPAMQVAITE